MRIEEVKARCEAQLMRLPNVVGVGIGEKAGEPVIKVLVTCKVPESSLQASEIVPKVLEGFAVDVEEAGTVKALDEPGKKAGRP